MSGEDAIARRLGAARRAGLVLALVLLTLGSIPAPVPGAASIVSSQVRDGVQRHGRARVLVEFRLSGAPHVPEGRLIAAAVAAQRAEIARVRRQVLTRLIGRAHRVLHQYGTVPLVALEIGPDAMAELEAASFWVARVVEDALHAPALGQSVPLIGGDASWSRGYDGTGTVVAILDTGVQATHPFLAGKVVEEACYSSNVSGASTSFCPGGTEAETGPGTARPCPISGCWHGTHVAGIAAGNGASAGVSFSGVAKGASIMAVQVFSRFTSSTDCGSFGTPCPLAWTSDFIAGLERVYALRSVRNVAAANLSLSGRLFTTTCDSDPTKSIIDNLRSVGIATVIASGNNGSTNAITAPACISSSVSVGATTKSDAVASYSNAAAFLSLLAPGSGIQSSMLGGAFGSANGTSMATPHVAGAWAVIKQAVPDAQVGDVLGTLQSTGVAITDTRNGLTKRRIDVEGAIAALAPALSVASVSPAQGNQGTTVAVTFSGSGFVGGAAVTAGAGITVTHVNVESPTRLTATFGIASTASIGARTLTVSNPGGGSAVLSNGFTVNAAPSPVGLTVTWNGKLRDRTGQGNTALGRDGALDGSVTVKVSASGGRTITALRMQSSTAGTWDTSASTSYWVLGAATTLDGVLANNPTTMAVAFTVADGGSFVVFGSDWAGRHFVSGTTLTITATFSDGTKATGGTTVAAAAAPGPAPTIAASYNGKARDRVGQGNTALAPDGALDGTLTLTFSATGGRTLTAIRMQSTTAGTWDTSAGTGYWVLGVASTATSALLNNPTSMAVTASIADGASLVLFGSDWAGRHFATGTTLTVTATFSDGSSATTSTTVGGSTATVTLTFNGKLRDRMGQGNTWLGADGMLDGTLTATLSAGGARTVTAIRLQSSTTGVWDTTSTTTYWAVGVAPSLDAALVNNATTMTVSFALPEHGSFVMFASDSAGRHFLRGTPLTLSVSFSDGSSATALAQVP